VFDYFTMLSLDVERLRWRSGQPFRNWLFPRRSGRSSRIRPFPRQSPDQIN